MVNSCLNFWAKNKNILGQKHYLVLRKLQRGKQQMDLPRILFVNEAFFPHEGGAERRAYETIKRLDRKGFEVKVITNDFGERSELNGVDVDYITRMDERDYFDNGSRKIRGVLKFTSAVKRALKKYDDYDIYSFDEFPLLHAVKGAQQVPRRASKIFTWHEVLREFYNGRGGIWRLASRWEKKISDIYSHNIAVSNSIRSLLDSYYGKEDVTVIENGVDVSEYAGSGDEKEWGTVFYVGRIEPHKQLDKLIKYFRGQEKFKLEIVGSGSQISHLRRISRNDPNIQITGHLPRDELIERMKRAWVFVMPSSREGFSIASLEAMAAGLPVVTTTSRFNLAANEIIKEGYNGIILKDLSYLMDTLENLWNNEERWRYLSSNALSFSRSYDWSVITDKMADLFVSMWV